MPTKTRSIEGIFSEDAVRQRAYLMWEADGRPDGRADHYWMKASEPLASPRVAKPKAAPAKPAAPVPLKARVAPAKPPKPKAAAAKAAVPAVKVKPAARASVRKAAKTT